MTLCRWLGAAVLAGLALIGFTPLGNLAHPAAPPPARPADAIVVLGSYMGPFGTLSGASLQRAVEGIRLARRGLAPLLVMTGARQGPLAEAEVRAQLAREFGVPADAVLAEAGGNTTRQEAVRVRRLLEPRGARVLLLVTSADHMQRARAEFERQGFEVVPAAVPAEHAGSYRPEDRLAQLRRWAQERAARAYYRLAAMLG